MHRHIMTPRRPARVTFHTVEESSLRLFSHVSLPLHMCLHEQQQSDVQCESYPQGRRKLISISNQGKINVESECSFRKGKEVNVCKMVSVCFFFRSNSKAVS